MYLYPRSMMKMKWVVTAQESRLYNRQSYGWIMPYINVNNKFSRKLLIILEIENDKEIDAYIIKKIYFIACFNAF